MTVEKIIDDKEQNDLRDLKQQIKSLTTIMKGATMGGVKSKGKGVSSPGKKRDVWELSSERVTGIT